MKKQKKSVIAAEIAAEITVASVVVLPVDQHVVKPEELIVPLPHIRRDASGKIVEYDASPAYARDSRVYESPPEPAPTEPTTMAGVQNLHNRTLGLIEESYKRARMGLTIAASRKAGPAINTRDKIVTAARRALEDKRRTLDQDEQQELARATREVRKNFKTFRDEAQIAYEQTRDEAHATANIVVQNTDGELRAALADLDARAKKDLADLAELTKKREARVRESEKAKPADAAPAAAP